MVFTLQAAQLNALIGLPLQEQILGIIQVITNCDQQLEHRGPVSFTNDFKVVDQDEVNITTINVNGGLRWAKALSNWVNNSGNGSYVECRKVENRIGENPTEPIRVYLPRNGRDEDPNVEAGDVIPYWLDNTGEASFPDSLDGKIGEGKWWLLDAAGIPRGWGAADGTANSNASNSSIDMTDHFVMAITSGTPSNTAFGSDLTSLTHDHGGATGGGGAHSHTVTIGSSGAHTHTTESGGAHAHSITGSTANQDITVTIDDHPDHVHQETTPNCEGDPKAGVGGLWAFTSTSAQWTGIQKTTPGHANLILSHTVSSNSHTHNHDAGTLSAASDGAHTHSVLSSGAHTHSGTTDDPGTHTHSISNDTLDNPLHKKLIFIERLNNAA